VLGVQISCEHATIVPCVGLYSKHIRCKFIINHTKGCIFVAPCVGLYSKHACCLACLHAGMSRIPPIPQTKNYGAKCLSFGGWSKTATM